MDTGRDAFGIRSLNRHTLEQIVAAYPAALLVVDASHPELPVVYANAAYERLTGYALAELAGHAWPALAREAPVDATPSTLKAAISAGQACRAPLSDAHKDGTSFTCDISVTPLHGPRGDVRYFLLTHHLITRTQQADAAESAPPVEASTELLQIEVGRAPQKVATIDRIDQGTGLQRFPYFQEMLRRDLAMARRDRRFVTLLVFEIVEFDVYRQTFGDKAADSCQRMIGAQIMRALRRAGDLCARYDDTTLVAAVIGQHSSDVQPLTQRIAAGIGQLKLHNPRAKSSRYIETRVSVISCPPGAHDDPEPLIARALAESRGGDVPARAVRP
jgi:diguanylate cyclase (GGDEF)-like protein/PAS domain S-box-containing protein